MNESGRIELLWASGTLEIRGLDEGLAGFLPDACTWDPRTRCMRAPAMAYADVVRTLVRSGLEWQDRARRYGELDGGLCVRREPRPFQSEALRAWKQAGSRGVVVLPTGAGKSHVALMAIDAVRRDTLVIAPTLDLVTQWYDLLRTSLRRDVGIVGGGEHVVEAVTVTTYDSAYIHMEHLGNRFGLVVFDECHHLPGEAYSLAAQACLAPRRLGLTATPERADGRHDVLEDLIGPTVHRSEVDGLTGEFLAEYTVERILVELTVDERAAYEQARKVYRDFVTSQGIRMSSPDGWTEFVKRSARNAAGREAMEAYQRQRRLAFAAPSKLAYVEHLLHEHRRDRVLLFTDRNDSVYEMSRRFLVPVITHQTKVTERSEILAGFASGVYNVVATSRVLNEGVDMPDAGVAIIFSGSGSVREHVQRLGRILRKKGDKRAVLYELVAHDTAEMHTSRRRREHVAYR
ncbi:MAG: DEAD/DEAH box helicase family protein [Deltaproteobacteria bacterium]|nr:DEAD/DEAH box helicase family protein [Deltaproteobacteria bacterium]